MKNISISFPTGEVVKAVIDTEKEKELAADFLTRLGTAGEFICNHSVSAGCIFDAYMRPLSEPVKKISSKNAIPYEDLSAGNLLWDGEKLSVVYGEVMEPETSGTVIGNIETTGDFERACKSIWYNTYREHELSTITVSKED